MADNKKGSAKKGTRKQDEGIKSANETKTGEVIACSGIDHCVVVEFTNEKDAVQRGMAEWLLLKSAADGVEREEIIEKIIAQKELVIIKWPQCDIKIPKEMSKIKCSFKNECVTIHAQGNWVECGEVIKRLERKGVAFITSKEDRREHAKKNRENEDDTNADERQQNNDASMKRNNKRKKDKSVHQETKNAKLKFLNSIEAAFTESDDDDEDELQFVKLSRTELQDKITILTEEIKKLRRDNERLRSLRCVNEDLPVMKRELKEILRIAQNIKDNMNQVAEVQVKKTTTIWDEPKKNFTQDEESKKTSTWDEEPKKTSTWDEEPKKTSTWDEEPKKTSTWDEVEPKKTSTWEDEPEEIQNEKEKFKDDIIADGCSHASLSRLVNDMLIKHFTAEELATSTLTGKNVAMYGGVAINKLAKKKLNEKKIEKIRCYAEKQFPSNDFSQLFRNIIRNKCNNESKRLVNKTFIPQTIESPE